jgi:hypothetical protein
MSFFIIGTLIGDLFISLFRFDDEVEMWNKSLILPREYRDS